MAPAELSRAFTREQGGLFSRCSLKWWYEDCPLRVAPYGTIQCFFWELLSYSGDTASEPTLIVGNQFQDPLELYGSVRRSHSR